VEYDGYPEYIKEPRWHVWNIPLAEFNDVNLGNVAKIAIGFGDGTNPGGEPNGKGTVYFEDIILRNGPAEDIYYDGSVYLDDDPFDNNNGGYMGYPLLLKQDCRLIDAGGDYIDELRNLIGKTTDWEGTPDNNVADIGFHYFNWYYVNAGDSNGLSADLNQDEIVNFGDFAILANEWLTTYDINELKTMASEWLRVAEPNVQLTYIWDANIGLAEFNAGGNLLDTQRIFLLMDGQYVGEIYGFSEGWPLGIDVSEYGGGEQQFKAVSIDSAGQVTCSNVTSTEFNCPLNYCFLPSSYEPNKPLYFSAFNPTEGNVSVSVYADDGNLVWSQDYNGVSFFDSIPAAITGQHEIDYVSFDTRVGELLMAGSGGNIMRFPDPTEFPPGVQALIIIPDPVMNRYDKRHISMVESAFRSRGIKCARFREKSAIYYNIASCRSTNPIKYIYIDGHGGCIINGILRTWVQLSDGPVVSVKKSDFTNPSDIPSWCKDLGSWESSKRTTSFYSMSFASLEYVQFDTCKSGRLIINDNNQLVEGQPGRISQPCAEELISDMSWALGMHTEFVENRAYLGWYGVFVSLEPPMESDYQKWTRDLWERLGAGDTLGEALFKIDGGNWSDPNAPINNYRLRGQWGILNVKLE
jgi:hypothetical protein